MVSKMRGGPLFMALISWLGLFHMAAAERMLKSTSLSTCQANSGFTASLFNVVFTPGNHSATVNLAAISDLEGSVVFDITLNVYGYRAIRTKVDPCDINMRGMCPMSTGKMDLSFNVGIGETADDSIPGIAYTIPDLDASARVLVNRTTTGETIACVEASFVNDKTVDLLAVKWVTAVIIGIGLVAAALMSALGNSNAAAHLAANTLSLLTYFQAQAVIGLTGVSMPPIVPAWTQNFMWSMGIIRIGWMQRIFTWYQRSTGGTAASLFSSLSTTSVHVQKRSLVERAVDLVDYAAHTVAKRANIKLETGSYVVYGIQRVGFRAEIETTNIFMTALIFFYIALVLVSIVVTATKFIMDLLILQKWIKADRFFEFRMSWLTILKGILYRITLIAFTPMSILCLWELTQKDSAALVVLAVFCFVGMLAVLGYAAFRIVMIARQSITTHQNPAYILFSNPRVLAKWGPLYIQFQASAYYYVVPILVYIVVKGAFVAFGQHTGITQSISFIIIELGALIGASVLRPWMDKSTNSFNIAICVMNALNAIFLLIITDVFGAPKIVSRVAGVVLFIANAAFSLVLLLMVIISSIFVFWRKNPDNKYQRMHDDRVSFMTSSTQLNTSSELTALAAVARGGDRDVSTYESKTNNYESGQLLASFNSVSNRSPSPSLSPAPPYQAKR